MQALLAGHAARVNEAKDLLFERGQARNCGGRPESALLPALPVDTEVGNDGRQPGLEAGRAVASVTQQSAESVVTQLCADEQERIARTAGTIVELPCDLQDERRKTLKESRPGKISPVR